MKKATLLLFFIGFALITSANIKNNGRVFNGIEKGKSKKALWSDYKLWFTRNGLDVYSRWTEGDGPHLVLKLVNRNSYAVKFSYSSFAFLTHSGIIVKNESGNSFEIKANDEKSGDLAGLYFYPPDNYTPSALEYNLKDIKVVKAD
jgi:hypothetical protein